jgi:hypothetical protein
MMIAENTDATLHRCRACGTTLLSAHHCVCLGCALHADCSQWAGSARDMYHGARKRAAYAPLRRSRPRLRLVWSAPGKSSKAPH